MDNLLVTCYRTPESFQPDAFKSAQIAVSRNALFPQHAIGPPHKTQQKLEVIAERSLATKATFTRLLRH